MIIRMLDASVSIFLLTVPKSWFIIKCTSSANACSAKESIASELVGALIL